MKLLKVFSFLLVLVAVFAAGFVYFGVFDVAADAPHWRSVQRLMEVIRDRSIVVRADGIAVPPLDDAKLIADGAEHYSAMCTGCHLAPGMSASEIRPGLNPQPPNLSHPLDATDAEIFWVIKHGIKMSAMPAWGKTHDDQAIWSMVAFVKRLPNLSVDQYQSIIADQSAGESQHHHHGDDATAEGEHQHHDNATGDGEKPDDQTQPDGGGETIGPAAQDAPADSLAPGADPANQSALPATAPKDAAIAVDAFFAALHAGDRDAALALLDPQVLIYESGGAQRSRDEYASEHLGEDTAFLKTTQQQVIRRAGDGMGDLAWVASEQTVHGVKDDKPINIAGTETMILRKGPLGWRIVHIHWSSHAIKEPDTKGADE